MRLVLKTAPCPATEGSNCVKEKDKFILYRDLKSGYRWRMRSPSGETFAHKFLRSSAATPPVEDPADGSFCSESSASPISISGRGSQWGRGAISFKP
jgi:hypothetical protein